MDSTEDPMDCMVTDTTQATMGMDTHDMDLVMGVVITVDMVTEDMVTTEKI
jgi:hypothetical protein